MQAFLIPIHLVLPQIGELLPVAAGAGAGVASNASAAGVHSSIGGRHNNNSNAVVAPRSHKFPLVMVSEDATIHFAYDVVRYMGLNELTVVSSQDHTAGSSIGIAAPAAAMPSSPGLALHTLTRRELMPENIKAKLA